MAEISQTTPFAVTGVFLSHNTGDEAAVRFVAEKLLAHGLTPWLDQWNLVPGDPFQEAIEKALDRCSVCVVMLGPNGMGPWQNEEMRQAIERRIGEHPNPMRVIPVILPGGPNDISRLPRSLARTHAVRLKSLDDAEGIRALVHGIHGLPPGPRPERKAQSKTPYVGLHAFGVEDCDLYFGREIETSQLLMALTPRSGPRVTSRLLGVLGPSGSGKSSLLQAGLLARVRASGSENGTLTTALFHPGADPLESLALAVGRLDPAPAVGKSLARNIDSLREEPRTLHLLARLASEASGRPTPLLLIVDQFEETFTLCTDIKARAAFLDNLVYAATAIGGPVTLVLGMRADFYDRCAHHGSLANLISKQHLLIQPMARDNLRAVIEQPAALGGVTLDPALIDRLIEDVEGQPGALPLLQHTLLELWERRRGGRISYDAYTAIGGIEGAVEDRAERIYGQLTSEEQQVCRRLLLLLVQPSTETEPTKKKAKLSDVEAVAGGSLVAPSQVREVVAKLAAPDSRLLTTSAQVGDDSLVEISHEALISAWGRLRRWVDESLEDLMAWHRTKDAALEWSREDRNTGLLLRGARLARALELRGDPRFPLTDREAKFVQTSELQAAREERLSDSATLDHLEASAPKIWYEPAELALWCGRGRDLVAHSVRYSSILTGKETLETVDRYREETVDVFVARLRDFERGLLSAGEYARAHHEGEHDDRATAWQASARAIAESSCYPGLVLTPQKGLVPLGPDPHSGLWEFAHLPSGRVPERRDGELCLEEESAIVLVLLPGGVFPMGAQADDPESANHDPHALPDEQPVHPVELSPFLIGKHPLTQGQWLRLAGINPSMFRPLHTPGISYLNPVECLGWDECVDVLGRADLVLPTEAQWEYAARAGSSSVWWTGNDPAALEGLANLSENTHSAINRFARRNPFGLADILGNVWEWCLDDYVPYTVEVLDLTGYRKGLEGATKPSRGGSYFNKADFARSAVRYFNTPPASRFNNRGARAARPVEGVSYRCG